MALLLALVAGLVLVRVAGGSVDGGIRGGEAVPSRKSVPGNEIKSFWTYLAIWLGPPQR